LEESEKLKKLKGKCKVNWYIIFPGGALGVGGGVQAINLLLVQVWIFSGRTQKKVCAELICTTSVI